MKRIVPVLALLLLLCGCRAPQAASDVFCVEDEVPAFASAEPVYRINFALPTGAVQTASTREDGCASYEAEDGSYLILTAVYPNADPETVMQAETGFPVQDLHPVASTQFGMSAYRYSWTSQGETAALVCSGALYCDGACCYCLQFRALENNAKDSQSVREQVMGSFSLYEDEGF